jgi:hypothetical protein
MEVAPVVLEEQATIVETDDGDHDRFTHLVLEGFKVKNTGFVATGNSVVDSMVSATPVVALCGKTWVPGRDPDRYPLCRTCAEIAIARGWRLPGPSA